MNCCAACFGDRGLLRSIIPLRATGLGRCDYCETQDVSVVAPAQLAEYFGLLISSYQRDDSGRLLIHWFREDWALFRHPRMDDPRAKDLLAEILDDGELVRHNFVPMAAPVENRLSEWEKLRDELMYHNRYFPAANIDLERLEELLSSLVLDSDEVPRQWYRARMQSGDTPIAVVDMGGSASPYRLTRPR